MDDNTGSESYSRSFLFVPVICISHLHSVANETASIDCWWCMSRMNGLRMSGQKGRETLFVQVAALLLQHLYDDQIGRRIL